LACIRDRGVRRSHVWDPQDPVNQIVLQSQALGRLMSTDVNREEERRILYERVCERLRHRTAAVSGSV
jgi:hypothetical protein